MKFFMKALLLLWLATLSCPCELTGHQFCAHKTHDVSVKTRKDIKKMWQKPTQEDIKKDTLNRHTPLSLE
ncbi:MAG: hypothetical protein IPN86_15270 [Saprospiraceae bacterium]|jgi:hypothetical protein|nr:hypothetical protein [Saprospiraceae bacterium]